MSDRWLLSDKIFHGFVIGWISIGFEFILLIVLNNFFNKITSYGYVLNSQHIAMIILAINMILFRFMIVKWDRVQTGKGLLLVIIAASLLYILLYKKNISF